MLRTNTCGELRSSDVGSDVTLAGWVHKVRTHGNLTFIDIRDRYGITQITLDGDLSAEGSKLHKEDVIQITGKVIKKPEANKVLATGEIEVSASAVKVLSSAKPLPLDENATDETRLKYRYLDIRRHEVFNNLKFRNDVLFAAREYFKKHDFVEFETPLLVKSTPEGARDYVVPSRVNKGKFYALPQSPQLYKQILMIGGVDRYFQVARCLRDEDLRADRQPEHTQLDFEMSFVDSDDVRDFVEGLMKHLFKELKGIDLKPFEIFSYSEAMERFGSDKPDIRFSMELQDVTDDSKKTDFGIFKEAEKVYALFAEKLFSRKEIDAYTELVKVYKAKGLAYVKVENGELQGGIAKFLTKDFVCSISEKDGTIFFVADRLRVAQTSLGQLRQKIGSDLELFDKDEFRFCWIKDFPLFSFNEDENKWEPEHHMFSMPSPEFVDDFEERPAEVTGDLWDLVMNGVELGSGSIRVSDPEVQERIMNFVGIDKDEADEKFGFLLEAYRYGGPVHGGMGLGADRLIALMLGHSDIREVIVFPKNKNAECPMDGSPSEITDLQLDELHIRVKD